MRGHVALGLLLGVWAHHVRPHGAWAPTRMHTWNLGPASVLGNPLHPHNASAWLRARHTLARMWHLGCARQEPCPLSTWGHLALGSLRWNQWEWVRRQDLRSMGRA